MFVGLVRSAPDAGASRARCPAADGAMPPCSFRGSARQISAARRRRNSRSPLSSGFSFFSLLSRWAMSGVKIQQIRAGVRQTSAKKAAARRNIRPATLRQTFRRDRRWGARSARRSATEEAAGAKPPSARAREDDRGNARPRLRREKERPRENARQLAAETVQRGAFEAHLPPVAKEDAKTVPEHRQEEDEQRAERGQARHGVRKEKPRAERREKTRRQQRAPEGIEKPPALDGRERFAPPEEPRQILHVPAHPAVRAGKIAHRTGGETVGQLHRRSHTRRGERPLKRARLNTPSGMRSPRHARYAPTWMSPFPAKPPLWKASIHLPRRPSRGRCRARGQRGA